MRSVFHHSAAVVWKLAVQQQKERRFSTDFPRVNGNCQLESRDLMQRARNRCSRIREYLDLVLDATRAPKQGANIVVWSFLADLDRSAGVAAIPVGGCWAGGC